jgi:hypothetical protein
MLLARSEEEAATETTVWVRGLDFTAEFQPGQEVLLDRISGSIALRHETGSLSQVDMIE